MAKKKYNNLKIVDHILVHHFLTIMRRKECRLNQYRICLTQIYTFLLYDALRKFDLPEGEVDIETPAEETVERQKFIKSDEVVLVAVLRGGLVPSSTLSMLLPQAQLAHVGLEGGKKSGQARIVYQRWPKQDRNFPFKKKKCIIIAPRIETGASAVKVLERIQSLRENAPMSDIVVLNVVIAPEGADRMLQSYPDVQIVTASLERGLNRSGEVVPGIGRTAERVYDTFELGDGDSDV